MGAAGAKISLEYLQEVNQVWGFLKFEEDEIDPELKKEIEGLVKERNQYRAKNDWINADKIRDQLSKMGVSIKDSNDATK